MVRKPAGLHLCIKLRSKGFRNFERKRNPWLHRSSNPRPKLPPSDPDSNGMSHLMEYALGIFPGQSSGGIKSMELVAPLIPTIGYDLLITLPTLQEGVGYGVDTGVGTNSWTRVVDLTGGPASNQAPVVRVPSLGSDNQFVRLQVTDQSE